MKIKNMSAQSGSALGGKHVHLIGMCGVTMAPLGKMFLDLGWKVSGSDAGIFPPMSDYLKQFPKINFYPGFHPEKVGNPDLVVVGNFIGPNNPEVQYVIKKNIPRKSFPEVLQEFVIKENSIVVVGTYGKTTIAALLALILEKAGKNPSYMSGGILKNFPDGIRSTNSNWSVVEGDEYFADRWSNKSKFFYYHPKYLVLTSVKWDHMDVFKTEEIYIDNFKNLISTMPADGFIVANRKGTNVARALENAPCKVMWYERLEPEARTIENGVALFRITDETGESRECKTRIIGDHMLENIIAAATLAREIGIEIDTIAEAINTFEGIRRRLEIRGKTQNEAYVIDDLAHSPTKANASLDALKTWYPNSKVFAVFEPNVGARTPESLPSYDNAFDSADEVIIPRLSNVKTVENEERLDGKELSEYLQTHSRDNLGITLIEDDEKLIARLKEKPKKDDIVVFLGSHGFRGMIEALC